MNAVAKTAKWISPEEYLQDELASPVRREYVDGWIFPRLDCDVDHCRISGNLLVELHAQLRSTEYEPFFSEIKLKIDLQPGAAFYYPDLMIVASPRGSEWYLEDAIAVIEIVSAQTERVDHVEKKWAYRNLQSIQYYVMVEQESLTAIVEHSVSTGWRSEVLEGPNTVLKLQKLGVEIPLERIYDETSLLTGTQ